MKNQLCLLSSSLVLAVLLAVISVFCVKGETPKHNESKESKKILSLPLIPREEVVRRRYHRHLNDPNNDNDNRDLEDDEKPKTMAALYQGIGTHYVDLWVGTPPQRTTVIVDTGSSITAFPCSGCSENCGDGYHTDQFFIEADSSTFHKLSCDECAKSSLLSTGRCHHDYCELSMSYAEGSRWTAYEARDMAYVGGPHASGLELIDEDDNNKDENPMHARSFAFEATFGCQYEITGLFKTQLADGIMGLDGAKTSFWNQIQRAGMVDDPIFSMCYARRLRHARSGTEAGAITFGGSDQRLHTSPTVYAKSDMKSHFYPVQVRKMYLREGDGGDGLVPRNDKDGDELKIITMNDATGGDTIVDSGTTDTYFGGRLGSALRREWQEMMGFPFSDQYMHMTNDQLMSLPTIILQLQGVEEQPPASVGLAKELDPEHPNDVLVAIPALHYMDYSESKDKWIVRLHIRGSRTILGGNTMMGHDITFDTVENRIGFAESQCDYNALMNTHSVDDTDEEGIVESLEGVKDFELGQSVAAKKAASEDGDEDDSVSVSSSSSKEEDDDDEDNDESDNNETMDDMLSDLINGGSIKNKLKHHSPPIKKINLNENKGTSKVDEDVDIHAEGIKSHDEHVGDIAAEEKDKEAMNKKKKVKVDENSSSSGATGETGKGGATDESSSSSLLSLTSSLTCSSQMCQISVGSVLLVIGIVMVAMRCSRRSKKNRGGGGIETSSHEYQEVEMVDADAEIGFKDEPFDMEDVVEEFPPDEEEY